MWWHHPQKKSVFCLFYRMLFSKIREFVTEYFIFKNCVAIWWFSAKNKITGEDLMGFSFHSYPFLIFLLKVFTRTLGRGTRLRWWCIILVLGMNKFESLRRRCVLVFPSRFLFVFIFFLWLEMNFVCLM
jgi:hypothetical protein